MVNIPVDVEAIARSYGIEVEYKPLGKISGLYVIAPDGSPHIVINSKLSRTRQRFTLGHELCHHVKPSTRGNGTNTKPGDFDPDKEHECNDYAAALLMPAEELRAEHATGASIPALAWRFDVSVPAMIIRLSKLGLLESGKSIYNRDPRESTR